MESRRISQHPVLPVADRPEVAFTWNGAGILARAGETIASALVANGVASFGRHPRDGADQGIFCANGQCSKCTVLADGLPVKSCMTPVRAGMVVESVQGLPVLPALAGAPALRELEEVSTDVLIIGGGPAGLSAAIELGARGVAALIVDDKSEPGGKLVLQTHKFFGSVEDSHAGMRGNRIGRMLAETAAADPHLSLWFNSTALFVFKDRRVGVLRDGVYTLVRPRIILNAAGAREKFLSFAGNSLVGIYGAGAFQTLANRDLVRPAERLFIVGGGNVGLIAGYHALQAGIAVAGLAEALPECGGYKVHADKLKRLGVPIFPSHTILAAHGRGHVEAVTIAQVDGRFAAIAGTEKTFACDTVLIAVGLNPIDEFTREAEAAGIPVFAAGDACEIAEASSAMFNGRIAGLRIAAALGAGEMEIPSGWQAKAERLKSHPGRTLPRQARRLAADLMPVIHCLQEIPCNPCATVCPSESIRIDGDPLMGLPAYTGGAEGCTGCLKCVTICPGLAITLLDRRKDPESALLTIPYEMGGRPLKKGDRVETVDMEGNRLGAATVVSVSKHAKSLTQLVRIRVPHASAQSIVSFLPPAGEAPAGRAGDADASTAASGEAKLCLCERVSAGMVRDLVRRGIRDLNQIKAVTRAGMGACGGKTCESLIRSVLRQEGIPDAEVTGGTRRPVFVEVPLGVLAGDRGETS